MYLSVLAKCWYACTWKDVTKAFTGVSVAKTILLVARKSRINIQKQ